MRKLASIVKITSCDPIPDTERLSVTMMDGKGWKVVTGRDEFKPGELAIYLEIDSYLPADDERYAFLKERCLRKFVSKSGTVLREGLRIKTCKLRGVVSQGLLLKLDQFVGKEISEEESVPGTDVTKQLKVEHYDEIREQLTPVLLGGSISGDFCGTFPDSYIPKTDEERIQNLGDWFEKFKENTWEVSSKDDGTSVTMFYSKQIDPEHPEGVCSRNNRFAETNVKGVVPIAWLMAKKYDVMNKLRKMTDETGHEYALQGELVGPGIQSDRDKYNEHEWHIFKIWDITEQKYINPERRRQICIDYMLPHVNVLQSDMKVFDVFKSCDAILKFAEGKTIRGNEREGLVFKCNEIDGLSFKAVSNRYLLKQE